MGDIYNNIPSDYIDSQSLLILLKEYSNPRDWMWKQVKKGELIRLKNGFFLIASRFKKGKDYPFEQLANLLNGPSYVSLEWALSYYQFIPERVSVVTSITLTRPKEFSTPIGLFSYYHLNRKRFPIGVVRKKTEGQLGAFLIATPEKALADWVYVTCQGLNQAELLIDLVEAKRIEKDKLRTLDIKLMEKISHAYKSDIIHNLLQVLKSL